MITSDQIRAARALLHLDQADLARRANVSLITVRRIERGQAESPSFAVVRQALEQAGAEFIPNGVRKRPARADAEARFKAAREISIKAAEELRGRKLLTDDDLYDEIGTSR